jgi:sugar lactone lactonase YvrE
VLALTAVVPGAQDALAQPDVATGELLRRVQCPPGYTARVYAEGLDSPDGLAISPAGVLHVAEERAGRVSRIDAAGSVTPVLTGLDSPEGLAFDPDTGALYVVEDVENGRLIERTADGTVTPLAHGLDAPEGVALSPGGVVYLTESNLQFAEPQDVRTRVAALNRPAALTRVITDTPILDPPLVHAWSYSGITPGPDGRLYVANELSGVEITRTVAIPGFPPTTLILTTTESLLIVDPVAGTRELFASGLTAPEGLAFAPGGEFPLYVAEEDVGGGRGGISAVDAGGQHAPFCVGFLSIEDVVVAADGTLYVSEDGSGSVIAVEYTEPEPVPIDAVRLSGPALAWERQAITFVAAVQPVSATLPITYRWSVTGGTEPARVRGSGGLSDTLNWAWARPGPQTITVRATNRAGTITGTHAIAVWWGLYLPLVLRPN